MGIQRQAQEYVFAAVVAELRSWNTAQLIFSLSAAFRADAYVRDGK